MSIYIIYYSYINKRNQTKKEKFMTKQIIKTLKTNVVDLEKRVAKQENYLANTSKLSKGFAKESTALKTMKDALKVESLRLSNAECMCF